MAGDQGLPRGPVGGHVDYLVESHPGTSRME